MKKHKFKPLTELYKNGDYAPLNLKVESESGNDSMKNFPSKQNHVRVESMESDLTTVPCPSDEYFERDQSAMEEEGGGFSKCCTGMSASDDCHRQLASSETSINIHSASACQSPYSEDVHSLKAPGMSEDRQMPENVNTSQAAMGNLEEDILDSQVNFSTCSNKDNDSMTVRSDITGDGDHKNVTSSAASVSSFPAGLEKSINVQPTSGSFCDPFSVKEGNKSLMKPCKYSGEAVLETVALPDRLGPSENSSSRDELGSVTPSKGLPSEYSMKQVDSSLGKVTDPNELGLRNEKNCVLLEPETGLNFGNPSATDSLNRSDRNEYLKSNEPITNRHELPLQSQTTIDNDRADELVDVRVCDICGDIGREALLAICSKCTDGAEHIYCMRIKMDEVPESDWICEDCMVMQEPKRHRQEEVDRLDSALDLSDLKDISQDLLTMNSGVRHVDKLKTNPFSKASCFYGKRRGSDMETRPSQKRRTLERIVQPKSPGSGRKTVLTRVSPLKIMDKGKEAACQAFSFGDQCTKVVEQANSPSSQKLSNPRSAAGVIPSLKRGAPEKGAQPMKSYGSGKALLTRVSSLKIIDKGKDVARQSSSSPSLKRGALEKGAQTLKSCGSGKALLTRVSSLKMIDKGKDKGRQSYSSGDQSPRKLLTHAYSSPGRRSLKPRQFREGKEVMRESNLTNFSGSNIQIRQPHEDVNPERTIVKEDSHSQLTRKHLAKKLFKSMSFTGVSAVPGSETTKASHSLRKDVQDVKATEVNENSNVKAIDSVPSSSYGISSPSANGNSCTGIQSTKKAKLGCSSATEGHLVASDKVIPVYLHPIKELSTPASANAVPFGNSSVPESECIWKGAFELEEGVKLPKYCSGIQAHLSTCASTKISELLHNFCPKVSFKEVSRLDTWPIQFQRNHPTEQDIAVYFFAQDQQSYSKSYKILLEGMTKHDLALEANFDGVQFHVYSSSLLPVRSQRWNSLFFLWGIFRVREVDSCSLQIHSLSSATLNQGLCIPVSSGTEKSFFPALENGSLSASYNSIQGLVCVDPLLLQSSTSTKSIDQSFEHEVSSVRKCFGSQGTLLSKGDTLPVANDPTETESFSCGLLSCDNFQKEDYTDQDVKSLGKTRIFRFDCTDKEYMMPLAVDSRETGFCSGRNHQLPKFPWIHDLASNFCQETRLELASGSSYSVHSGPSGSSDGGGCAKSDDGQVEQLQNLLSCGALNLDLSLGSCSEPDGQVDLDLGLGLSSTSKPKHCTNYGNSEDRSVSLALSLGMP